MTEEVLNTWTNRQARSIGTRVRRVRIAAELSVQRVADICTNELGFKMLRTTLANLEAGTRQNVTVGELSAVATALGVAPIALLFPVDEQGQVEVLPGDYRDPWSAWLWFSDAWKVLADYPGVAWDANAPRLDFIEAIQANAALTNLGVTWEVISGVMASIQSLDSDFSGTMLEDTRNKQLQLAEKAREPFAFLAYRQLPVPQIPRGLMEAIENLPDEIEGDDDNA